MNELTERFWPFIKVLALPYLAIMFVLLFPMEYYLQTPGGLAEVEAIIQVEDGYDQEGTISSTYIMSIKRPTFFQFMAGYFSDYSTSGELSGSDADYTNEEISTISYLDKYISVNEAVIVAYEKASEIDDSIVIDYTERVMVYGKADYLSHYDDIEFGDEFVQMEGDGGMIVTSQDYIDYLDSLADEDESNDESNPIGEHTEDENLYEFTFLDEDGEAYSVVLEKNAETGKFGLSIKRYYLVNKENTFPVYQENDSNIGGPSGGLLQTLAIYNMLIPEDITKGRKIAGTGEINYDGSVGYIGGVKQKIVTAYLNDVNVFFIPNLDDSKYNDNYREALRVCEELNIDPEGWLVPVAHVDEAIDFLNDENGGTTP